VRLKADENLPQSVVELVQSRGHDVHTVVEEGLGGAKDSVVARAALDEQRVLLTLDQDFAGCVAIVQLGAIRIRRPPGDEQISPSRPGH
jgi:predicted nuclease of predicted toxin-antitoxin system